jgi:hypothetical protein
MAYPMSVDKNWPSKRPKCKLVSQLKLRIHTHINTNRSSGPGGGGNGGGKCGDAVVVEW